MIILLVAAILLVGPWAASAQYANDVERRLALEEFHLGLDKMKAGAFDQASAAFIRAIRHDRHQVLAYYALGQAHAVRGRYDLAIEAYAAGIDALRSSNLYITQQTGDADNRADVVLRELRLLRTQRPESTGGSQRAASIVSVSDRLHRTALQGGRSFEAEFSLAAGSALFHAARYSEAENEWRYATSLRPEMGEAWNNLAALYSQMGLKQPALDALHAARKAGYAVDPALSKAIEEMK